MAEEAKQTPANSEATPEAAAPKKKGKLPLILILLVVLGAGGFFGLKGKGKKAEPPPIKLGEIKPLDEFLVNLRDGKTFLRTGIALQFKDGYKLEGLDAQMPAIKDSIVSTLSTRGLSEITTLDGKTRLKRSIAENLNKLLATLEPAEPGKEEKAEPKPAEAAPAKKTEKPKGAKAPAPKPLAHPDWDSQDGPVLKVYFTSFATQQ